VVCSVGEFLRQVFSSGNLLNSFSLAKALRCKKRSKSLRSLVNLAEGGGMAVIAGQRKNHSGK
jgi:hypothetical protein